ncbi:hypothetical protein [Calidifontibacter indicus]|uniref:hypothetical protein n=1 Tax=Calidifontibacter indicus TaxID=419650 RepID=UPI0011C07725|nr:hypothetical protein [Calidifontibacter indicus]
MKPSTSQDVLGPPAAAGTRLTTTFPCAVGTITGNAPVVDPSGTRCGSPEIRNAGTFAGSVHWISDRPRGVINGFNAPRHAFSPTVGRAHSSTNRFAAARKARSLSAGSEPGPWVAGGVVCHSPSSSRETALDDDNDDEAGEEDDEFSSPA